MGLGIAHAIAQEKAGGKKKGKPPCIFCGGVEFESVCRARPVNTTQSIIFVVNQACTNGKKEI
jgi:hypothetical protein